MGVLEVLPAWLDALGFEEIDDGKFRRALPNAQQIIVDMDSETILYPRGISVVSRTTSNFSHLENLVVLDCVIRLLEDGYPPSSITLEPTWHLGRGASGGRADVLVRDQMGSPYLLIECKTAGEEFEREWEKTKDNGGQLFTYAQQETDVRFLALYTSWLEGVGASCKYHVISHLGDEVVLSREPHAPSYRDAKSFTERHEAWSTTYQRDSLSSAMFSGRGMPYQVGQTPRRAASLNNLTEEDRTRKSAEFATILRKHNISGRENAFDVLVNIFVAKMTDELENADDLQFTWRGRAVETPYDLVERLEILYRRGMRRFLDEDVAYVEDGDIDNAMRFIKSTPDAAKAAIAELFRQQKFYSKSNFGLLDVHNEELFLLNSAVLVELVDMWQQSRLSVAGNRQSTQALGDMFEIFLDDGIKQTEGQYFTPWPVCDFMIDCIPEIHGNEPPRVLDFACGAGHSLTEYFNRRIAPVDDDSARALAAAQLHGIEKEYRLSKVSKVASAMYGALDAQIHYADTLSDSTFKGKGLGDKFDVLLSNPPYSVDGFLTQLDSESRESLAVSSLVSNPDKFDRIEEAFLQRSAEIVAPGGCAALIFPESFYDNETSDATLTRDILFSSFEVKALVKLPSGSFSMTGTSTWIAFLRRRGEGPSAEEHIAARVEAIFTQGSGAIHDATYEDFPIVEQYLSRFGLSEEELVALIDGDVEFFASQGTSLDDRLIIAVRGEAKANQEKVQGLSEAEVWTLLLPDAVEALKSEYKARLRAFWMLTTNGDCLIVRPGATAKGKTAIDEYLGYRWSKRKGHQGIHPLDSAGDWQGSPLFPSEQNPLPGAIRSLLSGEPMGDSDLSHLRHAFEERAEVDLREGVDIVSWPEAGAPLAVDFVPVPDISQSSLFPVCTVAEAVDIDYGRGLPEAVRNPGG